MTDTLVPLDGHGPASPRRWLVLAVLCASVFVVVLDGTIINVALPTLATELGATTSQLQWIGVVMVGALVAWRFLPARATRVPDDAATLVAPELTSAVG